MKVIVNCKDCPFNGQDNVYCRTCSIPYANREILRALSDVLVIKAEIGKPWFIMRAGFK